ncbi:MAG: hypothetical protein EA394_00365 [Bacteroidia bacterium]|nr:MAG: hypothetical protein EA394_00365 [Bacteroidia bacterium]
MHRCTGIWIKTLPVPAGSWKVLRQAIGNLRSNYQLACKKNAIRFTASVYWRYDTDYKMTYLWHAPGNE